MTDKNVGSTGFAERLIRHFQKHGFADVTEAVLLHFRTPNPTTYEEVVREFAETGANVAPTAFGKRFSLRFIESFSEVRSEKDILRNFHQDFGEGLRRNFPELFFEKTNYLFDENAEGTKYDLAIRIGRNVDNAAKVVLLNDPGASFVEFFDRMGYDEWATLCDDLRHTVGRIAMLNV